MTEKQFQFYKSWFADYTQSFYTANTDEQKNILLKEQHTFNVCRNITEISKSLNLIEEEINLAESVALFHDIGRFPQLKKYKTFRDSISVNHGLLGADVLLESNILSMLPKRESEIIIRSVKYHNALKIPNLKDEKSLFFLKLIRDADKLDIWRIFLEYFNDKKDMGSAAGLDLPDTQEYTGGLLDNIYKKEIISLSKIANLNDFKILQISWVFDLNFRISFELFQKRDYIKLLSTVPPTAEIIEASAFIKEYIDNRIKNE